MPTSPVLQAEWRAHPLSLKSSSASFFLELVSFRVPPHSTVQAESLCGASMGLLRQVFFGAGLEAPGRAAGKRRGRELRVARSPQQEHGTQLMKMD